MYHSLWHTYYSVFRSFLGFYSLTEAEKARETCKSIQKEIDEVNKKIKDLETVVAIDFGSEYQYYPLYDKCIEMKQRQYTYELCLFNKASQKEGGSTSLGTFTGWNEDKTAMKYENGVRCWSGPNRSCTAKVECNGNETNEIVSIDEPSRCVYEMVLKTASACDTSLLPALEQELQKLQ
jgi:protein kinase C substrate 80K-H